VKESKRRSAATFLLLRYVIVLGLGLRSWHSSPNELTFKVKLIQILFMRISLIVYNMIKSILHPSQNINKNELKNLDIFSLKFGPNTFNFCWLIFTYILRQMEYIYIYSLHSTYLLSLIHFETWNVQIKIFLCIIFNYQYLDFEDLWFQ
jgi:hypothetical protein